MSGYRQKVRNTSGKAETTIGQVALLAWHRIFMR